MYAQRKGWDPGQVEIRLDAEKDTHGVISRIELRIELEGGLGGEEERRLKEIATRCPTHKVLSAGVSIVHV